MFCVCYKYCVSMSLLHMICCMCGGVFVLYRVVCGVVPAGGRGARHAEAERRSWR